MRILASADLHGVMESYAWLATTARNTGPDAVILAGDLLGGGPGSKGRNRG